MSMFGNMLGADETLFRDAVALDYDYIPKKIPFREGQQQGIADCIKPLFQKRNGKNVVITGKPGVGKTVALRKILNELEDTSDNITPIYINCWQNNSTFKIFLAICDELDFKFTQNKRSEELFKMVRTALNKKSAVFVFDEIDKIEEYDFLYTILEEIYRKTIILISNRSDWLANLDPRVKSRLIPETIEFLAYNENETKEILKERLKFAFIDNAWEDDAFHTISNKAYKLEDVRTGLYLLREAGNIAESKSSKKITNDHAEDAIKKVSDYSVNAEENLEDDKRLILDIVKEKNGEKIGDLFKEYEVRGGKAGYKTFTRRIKSLEDGKFVITKKKTGSEGNTTIVKYSDVSKKLTDF